MDSTKELVILILMHQVIFRVSFFALMVVLMLHSMSTVYNGRKPRRSGITYSLIPQIPCQVKFLDQLINTGDTNIKDNLRLNRDTFMKLCLLLHERGGLRATKYVGISAQVSMFLDVLAHHTKNRKIRSGFIRSGETVSRHFKRVLLAVLKLHPVLLAKPQPVEADEVDHTWKCFQVLHAYVLLPDIIILYIIEWCMSV